jgi:hypothetical protein
MEQWHIAHHGKNLIPLLRDSHNFMHFCGIFTLFDENYDKFGTLGVCPQLVLCKELAYYNFRIPLMQHTQ